jgi:amino acid transporter
MSLREVLIGKPRDPLDPRTRHSIALIAFFAWVGLGADGLSSSCYGPEEAYLALGTHTHFGLYLAVAIAVTVFIISLAYNQVIEPFPNGGGYKVATQLIGPRAGLVSGAALIVDYVPTIAISIAAGADALFSLLPVGVHDWKIPFAVAVTGVLLMLNLRGMKEAIKVLLPIFLAFVVVHVFLIGYGIYAHAERMPQLVPETLSETALLTRNTGWITVVGIMMLAYSQGGAPTPGWRRCPTTSTRSPSRGSPPALLWVLRMCVGAKSDTLLASRHHAASWSSPRRTSSMSSFGRP